MDFGPCPLDNVPPPQQKPEYEEDTPGTESVEDEDDKAWSIHYTDEHDVAHHLVIVWMIDWSMDDHDHFELYEFAQE